MHFVEDDLPRKGFLPVILCHGFLILGLVGTGKYLHFLMQDVRLLLQICVEWVKRAHLMI